MYLILLKDKFPDEDAVGIDEMRQIVINELKKSNSETEEGYVYMTEENLLQVLKISKSKLKKVVKYAFKNELLKFETIKKVRVVVYTQERRLSINKLL